jgi:transglutaminase-like putative cysteine protease
MRWLHDPFDNSVVSVTFDDSPVTELTFDTLVSLEHFETTLPEYPLEDYAKTFPFSYSGEELPTLALARQNQYPSAHVKEWASRFLDSRGETGTMHLLRAMTQGIQEEFVYVRRNEKGVQCPEQTLGSHRGSCRDFAVLMMEGARSLGLAARFVSGYIFVPSLAADRAAGRVKGGGATHAWVQVYLPGAGWIDFDPTNSIIGNRNLIRVAMALDQKQVLPLWGTYAGKASAFLGMDVTVSVTEDD